MICLWRGIWYEEAHHSTAIEGNTLVLKQVERLLAEGRAVGDGELREYLEVRGYATAAEWVYRQALHRTGLCHPGAILSLAEARQVHYTAMSPVWEVAPHPDATDREAPGSFREHDIRPFPGGMAPISWSLVPAQMGTWIKKVNALEAESMTFPESLAELHCRFEQVHPFLDGNGRTGRLLLNLILVRQGYPPAIIYKRDRAKYLSALRRATEATRVHLERCSPGRSSTICIGLSSRRLPARLASSRSAPSRRRISTHRPYAEPLAAAGCERSETRAAAGAAPESGWRTTRPLGIGGIWTSAPAPEALARYLPKFSYLLLDMQRIGEQGSQSPDLVTALAKMERDPSPENLKRVMRGLGDRFPSPEFDKLREAVDRWVAGAVEAWQIPAEELASMKSLTEDGTMYERVKEMREQVHRDGIEQGLERGRAEGRSSLVEHMATRKFGAATAEQLTRVLEDVSDRERIAEVADAIIDCDSAAELIARVGG